MLSWLYAFGSNILATGDNQGTYNFDTRQTEAAFTFLRGLSDRGCAWISADQPPEEEFSARDGLLAVGGLSGWPYQAAAFERQGNPDRSTVLPFPSPSGEPAVNVYGPSFVVTPSTPERQMAAWLFLKWLLQSENQARLVTSNGMLPLSLHTGDAGLLDPRGHLVIVDRAKDVGALADGTAFAPQFVENKLKFSPFIREAITFGNQRPYVVAMIAIDLTTAGNWAEKRGLAYTSYVDLALKPEMAQLIRGEIEKCNAGLPAETRIRRFLLLTKDFDADDAEITRTRKLRRAFIADKYVSVIDAFYSGAGQAELVCEVTYEDGRKATVRSNVIIHDVGNTAAVQPKAA